MFCEFSTKSCLINAFLACLGFCVCGVIRVMKGFQGLGWFSYVFQVSLVILYENMYPWLCAFSVIEA